MVIYRELGNIEDHRRVYSSGALSQLPRGIGGNHEAAKSAKKNSIYREDHQRSEDKSMKAYLDINKLK